MSPALFSMAAAGLVLAWGFAPAPAPAGHDDDALPTKAAAKAPAAAPLATMRHDTMASLIAQLDSPVPAARALVACAMAERKADAAPAVPSLVAQLDDDAQVSPYICREEWWRNGDHDFGRWWHDQEPTTPGQEAARALAAIGTPSFTPVLTVLAKGGNHARRNAAWILGALRDERAVLPLVAQAADRVAAVRENVVWSLGAIRDQRAVDALGRVVAQDESADVRQKAAWALGAIRDPRAVDALMRALRDRDHDVRRQAAWALGAIRDGRAVDALIAALKDSQSEVRKQAAWALGAIGDVRATEGLTTALEDADADVRKQAAWALGVVVRHR
jgi:HEAT repeat protein